MCFLAARPIALCATLNVLCSSSADFPKNRMNAPTKTRRTAGRTKATQPAPSHREELRVARILVPTDFSDESKAALRYATRLAEAFGASIHLAHVIGSLGELKDKEVVPWNAKPED